MGQITGNDELLTKGDLQNYHERILPYLNGVTAIDNTFDVSNLHSTDEKMIGQWIDGKPLYQKTVSFTFNTTNQDKTIDTISNLDEICLIYGRAVANNDAIKVSIPWFYADNDFCTVFFSGNNLIARTTGTNYPGRSGIVTIQYTKTTDSVMTVPFGSVNDYSTTERIVGTWIDGKPIYQKTIQTTFPNSGSDSYTNIGATVSFAKVVSIEVLMNNGWIMPCPATFNDSGRFIRWAIGTNDVSANKNTIYLNNVGYSEANGKTTYVTVQYTKTTD